jgi:hypothetical protein
MKIVLTFENRQLTHMIEPLTKWGITGEEKKAEEYSILTEREREKERERERREREM